MSSVWRCLNWLCSKENECFFGLLPVKLGARIVAVIGSILFFLLFVFNMVSFFLMKDDALSWTPHLAISLTLVGIGLIIYLLVLLGSFPQFGEYTNAFYIIFLVMNAILFLFHVFFGSAAFGLALSLITLLDNAHSTSFSSNSTVWWQFGRALSYWIVSIFQLYSELVIERARNHWKRHDMDEILEQMAQKEINQPKKKKTNKVASVSFDSKA